MAQQPSRAARIVGYVLAIAANLAMLWVAYRILDWGWPPFVTDDWTLVLPAITVAAAVAIVTNAGLIAYDGPAVKAGVEIVQSVMGIVVTARMLQVFPFDVSDGWETLIRVVLVVGIVGSVIGILVWLTKLVRVLDAPEPAA